MTVLVKIHKDLKLEYAEILLNRPEKLNAFSRQMLGELESALKQLTDQAQQLHIHALIISSSQPKAFCVGADLSERIAMSQDEVSAVLAQQRRIMDLVERIPVPSVALLEGPAFGGGLELALAADLRMAAERVQLGLTETRLAIIPGAGGTQRLKRLVGTSRAKDLIYAATKISSERAFELGLVNRVSGEPRAELALWLKEVFEAGPLALRAAKAAIDGPQGGTPPSDLDWERQCYQSVLESQDRLEGLRAFVEKRPPSYKGN
jgi:methylglutaconyl-CoA hydratase